MSDPTLPQIIDSVKKQLALQKFEELLVVSIHYLNLQ